MLKRGSIKVRPSGFDAWEAEFDGRVYENPEIERAWHVIFRKQGHAADEHTVKLILFEYANATQNKPKVILRGQQAQAKKDLTALKSAAAAAERLLNNDWEYLLMDG